MFTDRLKGNLQPKKIIKVQNATHGVPLILNINTTPIQTLQAACLSFPSSKSIKQWTDRIYSAALKWRIWHLKIYWHIQSLKKCPLYYAYCPAFTGTHCTYPQRAGQAELTWSHNKMVNLMVIASSVEKVEKQTVPIFQIILSWQK